MSDSVFAVMISMINPISFDTEVKLKLSRFVSRVDLDLLHRETFCGYSASRLQNF